MNMLALLLLSAFAVYGFLSLLLSLTERSADALAVCVRSGESEASLRRRVSLAARSGMPTVILLEEMSCPVCGLPCYLRLSDSPRKEVSHDEQP